jgi:hypothetical protein
LIKVKFELHGSFIISFNGLRPWVTASGWPVLMARKSPASYGPRLRGPATPKLSSDGVDHRQRDGRGRVYVYADNTGNPFISDYETAVMA